MRPIEKVFIGVDERQPLAFNVLAHSIHATAKHPVSVIPLYRHQLPITRFGLTDFTFSRYLVPWLCDFKGRALFMDGDMVVLEDINDLFAWHRDKFTNGHTPPVSAQIAQPEFEWPSMMLFDNFQCQHLTPEYINDHDNQPQDLRRWAIDVGVIPPEWNVMVKASEPGQVVGNAKVLHFTEGLPCFFETQHTPGAEHWKAAHKQAMYTVNWKMLMGGSIHARPVLEQLIRNYQEPDQWRR